MVKQGIKLKDFISELRREIALAAEIIKVQGDQGVQFGLSEVEIEIQTVVTKSLEGDAKARFEIPFFSGIGAEATAKGAYDNAKTQKLTFKLIVSQNGKPVDKLSVAQNKKPVDLFYTESE